MHKLLPVPVHQYMTKAKTWAIWILISNHCRMTVTRVNNIISRPTNKNYNCIVTFCGCSDPKENKSDVYNHLCAQTHTYMRKSPWMAYDFILKTFCPNQILKLGVLRCPPVAIPDTAQGMPWKKNKCLIQHNLMLFSSILLKLKEQQIGKFESKYYRIRVIMFIWNAFIFQFL